MKRHGSYWSPAECDIDIKVAMIFTLTPSVKNVKYNGDVVIYIGEGISPEVNDTIFEQEICDQAHPYILLKGSTSFQPLLAYS